MLPVNLGDFVTGGGMLNPLTGEFNPAGAAGADKFGNSPQNPNPYGFTAPTGPSTQALVPYYNKATGQTWTAPSGGYTPPSADWLQGSPNSQISPGGVMPMPQYDVKTAPYDPNRALPANYQEARNAFQKQLEAESANNPFGRIGLTVVGNDQFGQQFGMASDAEAFNQFYNKNYANTPTSSRSGLTGALGTVSTDGGPVAPPTNNPVVPVAMPQQQPYMPIMGGNQNVGILSPAIGQQPRPMNNPAPVPQQPAPTPGGGGLGSLLTPQRPVQAPVVNRPTTPPVNAGGLNSLIRPQTPVNTGFLGSTQPVTRNQVAPRAGSLPSLRIRPTFQRSLPVPFAKPPFRR